MTILDAVGVVGNWCSISAEVPVSLSCSLAAGEGDGSRGVDVPNVVVAGGTNGGPDAFLRGLGLLYMSIVEKEGLRKRTLIRQPPHWSGLGSSS